MRIKNTVAIINFLKYACDRALSTLLGSQDDDLRHHLFFNRRQREVRQIILDFNRSITLIVDLDALMSSIALRINELFDADRIIILHTFANSNIFSLAFSLGYQNEELKNISLTTQDRLAKWLLNNIKPMIIDRDKGACSYLSLAEREMLIRLNTHVCVPLLALNRLTGVMLLSSTQPKWKMDEEQTNLLVALISQASIAFENAYLFRTQKDRLRKLYRAERLATAGRLAASVAHEIRNPLTAIRSTVQYLSREFDENHPKRALVDSVISEVDRIDRTVDGLLNLTRQTEFSPSQVSLTELIGQSLVLIRAQAQDQGIDLFWEERTQTAYVMADVGQFKQLLLNLLMNAMQAMPGGGQLQVDLTVESQTLGPIKEKDLAVISIADNGYGIPADYLDKVFDPFFTTKKGGTGLGLSTCYAIAKQHGGELEINSRENQGTTVTVKLPLIK